MTDYPGADKRQDFSARYPGDHMTPNTIVLHTTEGSTWPGYAGGSEAPNLTIRPNMRTKRLDVRQHFPLNMSSRALVNAAGGVETNTLNCVQIELVGTCAKGGPGLHWPTAPDWAIEGLGEVIAKIRSECPAIPLKAAPLWLPYPESYGQSKARMSNRQWLNFYGVCGHQHVPENDHGDPGDLPIEAILAAAGAHAETTARKRPAKKPDAAVITRPERAAQNLEHVQGKRRKRKAGRVLRLLRRLFPNTRR